MQNRTASQTRPISTFAILASLLRICMLLIAAMAPLARATHCLAAGQREPAPAQTGVTARYLGRFEADSAVASDRVASRLARPSAIVATATPPAILSFDPAEVGASGTPQQLTASFSVSGFSGSFTPTATLHYGHDYTLGTVTCTAAGGAETCNVPVVFDPALPGARKDAIFLMNGTTRLATVLLDGLGRGPLALVQPGAFTTTVPSSQLNASGFNYIYQSVADENGIAYLLPSGNADFIVSVTKAGVATKIPLTKPPYFWSIGIDGAGVLYLFGESATVLTYDTVQKIQGTYQIPYGGTDIDWYPGVVGDDQSVYVVDQIRNNGIAYKWNPNGSAGYADTLNPGVLQPFTAAVDSAGDFFVGGYTINKITPAGVQTQVNTVGASEGLAVDAADTLYATRYSPTGGVAELPAANYTTAIASIDTHSSPLGVSLGSDGTVYVSNYVNLDIFDRSATETVDFGEVSAGDSSTLSSASIYNGGNQPLNISGLTLSGLSDSGFSLDFNTANECTFGIALAPGELCQASVVFAPTHPGKFSGTISISSNSLNSAKSVQSIQLTGTSYGSYDVLSPDPLAFGTQAPGTSKTLPVTMSNMGDYYASTIYSATTDNAAFSIALGTCTGAVQVGASCQLQVTFSPGAAQAYAGNATIVTYVSGTAQPFQTIILPLSGNSISPAAATPVISPGTGTYSSTQQITIADATANATIHYTTDGSAPSTNSPKYTSAIKVASAETLKAFATAPGYSQSEIATATYTFLEPVAVIAPSTAAFGNQIIHQASAALTVTLKNTGVGALTLTGLPISGSGDFSQTNTCGASVAAGNSCTISIVFTPSSLGSKIATLTVNSNGITPAPTVALTGTGVAQTPVISISPASLDFGSQIINVLSTQRSVTITNISSTDTVILNTAVASDSAFNIVTATCLNALKPGQSCTLPVTFTPAAAKSYTATVSVEVGPYQCGCVRNYPPQTFSVSGSGIVQPPVLKIAPSTLDFGNQIAGLDAPPSAPQKVTVTNISATDTIFVGDVFTASSSAFNAYGASCMSPLAPGMSCTVQVTFIPASVKTYSATITFQPQPSGCGGCKRNYPVQTLAVTGTGINPPPPVFAPVSLAFGTQVVGSAADAQTVTLTNPASSLPITIIGFVFDNVNFSFKQTNDCPATLTAGASCKIQVLFAPTGAGTVSVDLRVNYSVQGGPAYALAPLTGTGVLPPPPTFTPASLAFGSQPAGTVSAAQTMTVTNPAAAEQPVAIINLVFGGNTESFQQTNNCSATLAAGASCQVQVRFAPRGPGVMSDSLRLNYNEGGGPAASVALLTGSGIIPPAPTFTPASLAFGSQPAGTVSAPQTMTVTNPAAADQPIVIESFALTNGSSFQQTNSCPETLAAGASCQIEVSFAPKAIGQTSDSLRLNFVEDGGPSYSLATLSGSGTAPLLPAASLSPNSFSFTTTAGTTSAAQTATLKNKGTAPLEVLAISVVGGAGANDYSQTNDCGTFLEVGASCTISVRFTPANPGSYPSTLTVTDNDPASPQTISLTGSGTNMPDFVVASSTPPQMILPGGSAQFSLAVTAQNGASIPAVTLTATGLPPGATASFSQSSVVPGSTSATSTLTISTSRDSAAVGGVAWRFTAPILGFTFFLFLPVRRWRRWAALTLLLTLSLGGIAVLSGCGGSSLPPAKTYNVTITGTVGWIQQNTTVELTIR